MNAREMFESLGYEYKHYKQRISYAKTVNRTTTLIVFDLKTKQAYCECGMGLRVFNSEESKVVQQQKKELGWLEEEKQETKQETNLEHYFEDLLKIGVRFAFTDGKIKHCYGVNCSDECAFGGRNCEKEKIKWLKQPYKKPTYKLTKFEKELLQCYQNIYRFKVFNSLSEMKKKGYFKGVDEDTTIEDILANCEVIE